VGHPIVRAINSHAPFLVNPCASHLRSNSSASPGSRISIASIELACDVVGYSGHQPNTWKRPHSYQIGLPTIRSDMTCPSSGPWTV